MPPKNHYTAPRAISWADLAEEEEQQSKDPEAQRLVREDNTPYTMSVGVVNVGIATADRRVVIGGELCALHELDVESRLQVKP